MDHLNTRLTTGMTITYCVFSVALTSTLIRIYSRGYVLRVLGVDDYLIACAMVFGIAWLPPNQFFVDAVHNIVRLIHSGGMNDSSPAVLHEASVALKHTYVTSILYTTELGFIKISILAFYLRFIPRGPTRKAVYVVAILLILFTLAICLATVFQCRPVTDVWNVRRTAHACPVSETGLQLSTSAVNLLTDLVILLLPVRTVVQLQLNRQKKLGLGVVFCVGIVGTIVTAVRLWKAIAVAQMALVPWGPWLVSVADTIMWSQVEENLIILCANLPALAALWNIRFTKQKSSNAASSRTYGRSGLTFELGSHKENGVTTSAMGRTVNSSEEHIIPLEHDILRSTKLVVSVEEAGKRSPGVGVTSRESIG